MSEDDEEYEAEGSVKPKPWMLHDISPEAREITMKNAKRHNVRMGQWVNYIIVKYEETEAEQEAKQEQEDEDRRSFSEMVDEFPTKGLMINIYNRLNSSIEELSKKVDRKYRPWWKFWG